MKSTARLLVIVSILSTAWFGGPAEAGAHTWDVNEAFMTADGKIWFIELREANGTPGEVGVGGHILSSTLAQFTICINPPTTCNVVSPTSNKMILFGNRAYVELARAQGAALPDQVVNTQSFVNLAGDTLTYNPYDVWSTGAIPSDGLMSRNRLTGDTLNSPRNYAGLVTGSIDAARPSPSVVPDGDGATNPVLVTKIDVDGNDLRVTWDTSICELDGNHQLIYGELSDFPAPGGTFSTAGSVCNLGDSGVLDWIGTPNANDGSGLIWWVILTNNGANVEGSWGTERVANVESERRGPGLDGSSGECGVITKDVRNTCGS